MKRKHIIIESLDGSFFYRECKNHYKFFLFINEFLKRTSIKNIISLYSKEKAEEYNPSSSLPLYDIGVIIPFKFKNYEVIGYIFHGDYSEYILEYFENGSMETIKVLESNIDNFF